MGIGDLNWGILVVGDEKDEAIISLRRRADRNAHGHIAQALRLKLLNDLATFIATIGGATIMTCGAVLLGIEVSIKPIEFTIAGGGAVVTLVGVWQAVWQPGERSRRHKKWATRFAQIEDECRLLQCGEGSKNLAEVMTELTEAADEAELVSERYWRRSINA